MRSLESHLLLHCPLLISLDGKARVKTAKEARVAKVKEE